MNLKKFKVGPNLLAEYKNFRAMGDGYAAQLAAGTPLEHSGCAEHLAGRLYTGSAQKVILKRIDRDRDDCCTFWFAPDREQGQQELAGFLAGQHVGLSAIVDGSPVSRAYSLISSPAQAREGLYGLMIKAQGFLSTYMVEKARVGDRFEMTCPGGDFVWNPLRDADHIVALASGSGVAAFLSMAKAVRGGDMNAKLTLLYTCPWADGFLHKDELDDLTGRGVDVRYFCPDCPDGSLRPLSVKDVSRAAGNEPYSLFLCGSPEAVNQFAALTRELSRKPVSSRYGEPAVCCAPEKGKSLRLRVKAGTITYTISALPGETILTALERAGVSAPALRRGAGWGYSRGRVLSGEYRMLPHFDDRLSGEEEAGWLLPACAVPLTDMELEIFPGC